MRSSMFPVPAGSGIGALKLSPTSVTHDMTRKWRPIVSSSVRNR